MGFATPPGDRGPNQSQPGPWGSAASCCRAAGRRGPQRGGVRPALAQLPQGCQPLRPPS